MKQLATCSTFQGLTTFGLFSKDMIPVPACRDYINHPLAASDAISRSFSYY